MLDQYLTISYKIRSSEMAKEQEVLMQSGQWSRVSESSFTLHDLMTKYKNEITPKKKRS